MDEEKNIKAIIGLGNPGAKYYNTRHSIGFLVLDVFADRFGARWETKDIMEIAEILCNGKKIILIKPQTFMNSSGKVVPFLQKKGIKPENIIVVHDEIEKDFGKVTERLGGSARGHNGLKSIITYVGSDFWRIRCGVGRPDDRNDVSNYVLRSFSESDEAVEKMVFDAVALLEKSCTKE
ncbi:aminoacyl-tRNA hydrolase [bacterium]|jgi:peptidyl-tRNA hydrolase, PTH1 family|nr:aminoacyl-tRNA hydrolase [bacterium]